MELPSPPEAFGELPFYSAHFMDTALWEPFVHWVALRHGYEGKRVLPCLPGTYPTFILEMENPPDHPNQNCIVIKFFGQLFDGANAFQVERSMGHFIAAHPLCIGSPAVLAEGQLDPAWSYLIFEHVPGVSIGEVRAVLPAQAMEVVAQQMGLFMRELHTFTAADHPVIPWSAEGWQAYAEFLNNQRMTCVHNHQRWRDLPPHLLERLPDYIPQVDQLLDASSRPHFIHADLTSDHLLGRIVPYASSPNLLADWDITGKPFSKEPAIARGWESMAIIDWGDTRVGNILYELVALHLDLFRGDKHLLKLCLQAYELPIFYQLDFTRKALSMVLLHEFPMPAHVYAPYQDAHSLDELAEAVFGM